MIADPPFDAGAVKAIEAVVFPAVTRPIVGASGTVAGVPVVFDDALLDPTAFFATIEQVYAVPFVSPVTTIGLDVPSAVTADPPDGVQLAV